MKQFKRLSVILLVFLGISGSFASIHARIAPDEQITFHTSQDRTSLKSSIKGSIEQAQHSILLFSFSLSDPDIIEALNKKAEAGLRVTVVVDRNHLGPITKKKVPAIELVTRSYGEGHLHHKLLVIDESELWMGSANFTKNAYEKQENFMFHLDSPEIAQLLSLEADIFKGKERRPEQEPLTITTAEQCITFYLLPHNNLGFTERHLNSQAERALIEKIELAKTSIKIAMNAWTRNDLAKAVIAAHNRGVQVDVIAPDLFGNISMLIDQRVPVTIYNGPLMHNKFMCIDDSILVNGSANWSSAAFTKNDESFMIIDPMTPEQQEVFLSYWSYLTSKQPDEAPDTSEKTIEKLFKEMAKLKEELKREIAKNEQAIFNLKRWTRY